MTNSFADSNADIYHIFISMTSKITLSRYSTIITTVLVLVLFVACLATLHEKPAFFIILSLYLILLIFGLLYGAMSVKADSDYVTMRSPLKSRKIPVRDIESIELFKPTMGAIRIIGSGGFMGYWGLFKEGDIGRYRAFYGKASDCFLIRMKNGDKYVLGCESPAPMVDYINSHLSA